MIPSFTLSVELKNLIISMESEMDVMKAGSHPYLKNSVGQRTGL